MSASMDGAEVVLLHPIGLDTRFWADVAPAGALALDFPGFGTAPWEGSISLPRLVDYVAGHIRSRATVMGVSLGAMVSLGVASRHPELVRSVVVACGGAGGGGRSGVMRERADATRAGGMQGVLATTLERWFTAEALATPGHPGVAYARQRLLDDDPEVFASYWEAMGAFGVGGELGSIKVPVTVIAGAQDRAASVESLRATAEAISGAVFEVLEGPHMLPLEQPDSFRAAITRHLDRLGT